MIHVCKNCYKTFKTVQHLNQHENRKRKCKPYVENNLHINTIHSTSFSESLLEEGKYNIDDSENETSNDYICKLTDNDTENNSTTNKKSPSIPSINSSPSISSKKSPDMLSKIDVSHENLSVTNLLDFINSHKKILEEKNKLESTLIMLKKHVDSLTRENFDLKSKITLVNDFVFKYKTPYSNINKKVENSNNSDDEYTSSSKNIFTSGFRKKTPASA